MKTTLKIIALCIAFSLATVGRTPLSPSLPTTITQNVKDLSAPQKATLLFSAAKIHTKVYTFSPTYTNHPIFTSNHIFNLGWKQLPLTFFYKHTTHLYSTSIGKQ